MTSSQKKFRTEYKQWPSYPRKGRKLNCRVSQQGVLYNGVYTIAFGDRLVKGGGGGGEGVYCNVLGILSAIWLLSINC